MGQQLELAKKRLFDEDSLAVSNIKLYPGTNRDTSADQFAEQINKSISLIEAGQFEEVGFKE
jgi:hypothetical protein